MNIPGIPAPDARKQRAVGWWLMVGVAMLVIQVALGGITRLTGSGLSITEWKPILGAIPPMDEAGWSAAFEKYKGIAQYQYVNSDFTLSDFKGIYFWEWLHREWARLIGVVFLIPFVFFWIRGYFKRWMLWPFIALFILGALQGLVGWIMVQSGLNDTDVRVSHIRLAAHFMAAMVLVVYTFWFALRVRVDEDQRAHNPAVRNVTVGLVILLTLQLIWGAFMAGLRAAPAAATWPTINGEWFPSSTTQFGRAGYTGMHILTDNPLVVHFIHRTLGYLLMALIIGWAIRAAKAAKVMGTDTALARWWRWPVVLVIGQVLLGIVTVLLSPKARHNGFGPWELVAQVHQLVAMALLLALMAVVFATSTTKTLRIQSSLQS